MAIRLSYIVLCALYTSVAVAEHLTGTYPPPFDLSSNDSLVAATWQNFTQSLGAYLDEGKTKGPIAKALAAVGVANMTFSAGIWSLHDPAANELQYHYASPETVNKENGTNQVDADSIYKVASVTKLVTVLAGLRSMTNQQWNTPLSEIYPVLAERMASESEDPVLGIRWDQITPWSLAQHMSGINSYAIPNVATAAPDALAAAVEAGYPPESVNELGPCWLLQAEGSFCNIDQWIEELSSTIPLFETYTSPQYSNAGYVTLGAAIANLTGQPIFDLWQELIFSPLSMDSSFSEPPSSEPDIARSVVVGEPSIWFLPGNILSASGGLFSTLNDLNKLGVGILNSTLLPANETRKWMKPTTHTASYSYSFGAPWEIIRYQHPTTGKITDIYSKSGDSGTQGGMLAMIPEYGAGFSFLNGAANATLRGAAAFQVLDLIAETLLPALDAQAAVEAQRNFVGTYRSTEADLNSSIIISFNESSVEGNSVGLSVSSFISNGSEVLGPETFAPRLLPAIMPYTADGTASVGQTAFRWTKVASYTSYSAAKLGPWSAFYGDWILGAASQEYFQKPDNLLVFDVDVDGKATGVRSEAFRVSLEREEDA